MRLRVEFKLANEKKRDLSIMLVRIVAMLFIFIDHLVLYIDVPLKNVILQITNSGVLIFLFISGFLYGGKNIKNIKEWMIGRIKHLLIPYWIFLFVYFLIQLIRGIFNIKIILIYFFVLQGFLGSYDELRPLWFMTLLFLCYMLVPCLQKLKDFKLSEKAFILYIISVLSLQIVLAFKCDITLDFGHPLSWYIVAIFVFSLGYISNNWVIKNGLLSKTLVTITFLMIISCVIRIFGQKYLDNTVFYDRVISIWTNVVLDIWIFIMIRAISISFENRINRDLVQKIDKISYCFYLVHFVVISRLEFLVNKYTLLFVLLSLIIAYVSASILQVVSSFVVKRIS